MRVQWLAPTPETLKRYLQARQNSEFAYGDVGASRGEFPARYSSHSNRFYLGTGPEAWTRAKAAINAWQAFNTDWAIIYPHRPPLRVGQSVAVCFRVGGLWWLNACRIVYTVDEADAYGFAYGTLPGHVGRGEEYFGVERDAAGNCHFVLKAFSQPAFWGARLMPFALRAGQQRFIRAAATAMRAATEPISSDWNPTKP